jgi:hypothetical protein
MEHGLRIHAAAHRSNPSKQFGRSPEVTPEKTPEVAAAKCGRTDIV